MAGKKVTVRIEKRFINHVVKICLYLYARGLPSRKLTFELPNVKPPLSSSIIFIIDVPSGNRLIMSDFPHDAPFTDLCKIRNSEINVPLMSYSAMTSGGTQPHSVFRAVDYQLVIKCSVETRPKKACVSTLYLKWCMIIRELQNAPWPRPALLIRRKTFDENFTYFPCTNMF